MNYMELRKVKGCPDPARIQTTKPLPPLPRLEAFLSFVFAPPPAPIHRSPYGTMTINDSIRACYKVMVNRPHLIQLLKTKLKVCHCNSDMHACSERQPLCGLHLHTAFTIRRRSTALPHYQVSVRAATPPNKCNFNNSKTT